jgi:Flp pilus assembly pilin Flp
MRRWRQLRDDWGQSLIEYTLLLGFLALSAVVVFWPSTTSVLEVWDSADTQLTTASTTADAGTGTTGSSGSTPTNSQSGDNHHHHRWWRH